MAIGTGRLGSGSPSWWTGDVTISVARYDPADAAEWNAFVARSRNGTFLFDRRYMDYHADRFTDASLVIRADGRLLAVLPADRRDAVVRSHGGLTYGGLVLDESAGLGAVGEMLAGVSGRFREDGATTLVYKPVPWIYARMPSEEPLYALHRAGARLVGRDVLTVYETGRRGTVQDRRTRAVKKARKAGLTVSESRDYAAFWPVLDANLRQRHGVSPVHSVTEISMLAARFPENIRLFTAGAGSALEAGAVVYVSSEVCHVQYNAASETGKEIGALDLVLEHLAGAFQGAVRFFDFGASTEERGAYLNEGLVSYKEGFGGRTVVQDTYELPLTAASRGAT